MDKPFLSQWWVGSPTEEAFDKYARGAMHTKREGKAL